MQHDPPRSPVAYRVPVKFTWSRPDSFPADEAQAAKDHWGGLGVAPSFVGITEHSRQIARDVLAYRPATVLEFGCNTGRNLLAIREADPNVVLRGVDINREAVEWGRAEFGLDLDHGDEAFLPDLPPGAFDVTFTVSVLDHVPEPAPILAEMTRVSAKAVLLLEPWLGEEGKTIDRIKTPAGEERARQPYSYSWDYERLANELGLPVEIEDRPIVAGVWGPYYKLYRLAL